MKTQPTLHHFLAALGCASLAISSASADDGTWIGDTNTDSFWTNTALWQNGIIADGTDSTAFFTNDITANRTVNLNGVDRTIGNITFTDATPSNNLTIAGNVLTLDVTTGLPIIDVTQSARTLTISSNVAGTAGLEKSGTGRLLLTNNDNPFSGAITISAGTLQIGDNGNARLGGGTFAGDISIASGANLHIYSTSDQTLSGIISGDGDLLKSSAGTLTLGNSNTYTGKTSILPQSGGRPGGTLSVSSINSVNDGTPLLASSSLGAPTTEANGTITIGSQGVGRPAELIYTGDGETTDRIIDFRFNNNGSNHTISNTGGGLLKFTSTPTSNRGITSNGSGFITLSGDGDGEFSEGIPIGVSITKSGSGTWTLGGPVGIGPKLTVEAGTLALQKKSSLHNGDTANWTAEKINVKDGATLALNVDSEDVDGLSADSLDTLLTNIYGGTSTGEGLQEGAILGLDTSTATGGSFTQGDAIADSTGAGGGSLGLTKLGSGTLILDKANTYTGPTTISDGTLAITGASQGTSSITFTDGSLGLDTGVTVTASSAAVNLDNGTITVSGTADSPSYTLLTAASITGTPVLAEPVPGYELQLIDGDTSDELRLVQTGDGPGPLDKFAISAISSPQTVGTPITGITITAQDASNQTVTSFNGSVEFSGTGGFSGTSATFSSGVLTGVSITPTVAGSNLTFTVTDSASDKTGSTTIATIQTQYEAWADGAAFDADANGDGVSNGLAFLLGATGPNVNALGLLPTATETAGGLVLTFDMRDAASRGAATLSIEHSSDLGISDAWTTVAVPDADGGPTDGVSFTVTGSGTLNIEATISSSEATAGKLFGRLKAEEN